MHAATSTEITGQIERITFHNEENGFTVAHLRVKGQKDLVPITGVLPIPTPGQCIRVKGEWKRNPKYGDQLEIIFAKTELPAKAAGIEKFLGSGMIKGIGPGLAARIVKKFGDNTLEIIDKAPSLLQFGVR